MARTMQTAPDTNSQRRRSGLRAEAPSLSLSRFARKQTTAAPASQARDSSISNDEAADSSVPDRSGQPADGAPSHRYSTRASDTESNTRSQRAQRRIASNVDDHNRDDSDDSNDASSGGPTVRRQSQRTQADRPETSSRRNSGRRSGKTLAASTRGRKVLKAVSTTAHRQRRRGFAVSTRLGTTSEEDQEHQRIELVLADDLDNDDVDDDEEGNGRPARMRSVSIAGYLWKSQEVALRADTVVKALRYHRLRCIDVRLDKRSNADLSGSDDGDYTDVEDPNFFFRGVKFKRGQLAYFLPDPEWLGDRSDEQEPLTKDSLEPNDWWLAVVLDCGELNYTDGSSACVLRVAWCYSPDQARELFASDPNSRWAKQLEKHDFWDNEMLASDHVDFVGAECTGGRYKGGVDQNAEEIALEIENQKAYDKAYKAWKIKYREVPKHKQPRFVPPEPKVLPKSKDGKVCIRLMIRGLEQSDVDRCSSNTKRHKKPLSKRWIEEIEEPRLDEFAEKWATMFSHKTRCRRFNIPTQTVRRTIASQDERTAKELQLHDLEVRTSGYGGKGKDKGRGKTVLPPSSAHPGVANKRKASAAGYYSTGGKNPRRT